MRVVECKTGVSVLVALAIALSIASCSDRKPSQASDDAGDGAGSDAPGPDCVQMQRDYVNRVLAPDQQTDVATTVQAVLAAPDFPHAMPYCSGARPLSR
jgi:hypothetical protein